MKTELSGSAADLSRALGTDPSSAPSAAEQDAWARQLAAMLTTVTPMAAPIASAVMPESSGAPTPQPTRAPSIGTAEPQNSDAASDNRLTLTITTEALGEVSILIDRAEGGVRVVLGVAAQAAETALMPEKMALARALTAVGLTVHSVSIVRQTGLGTVPAQPPSVKDSSEKSKVALFTETAKARKRSKRIDVVG